MRHATELVKQRAPSLMIEGEMMADTALSPEVIERDYPFSSLKGSANVLIFPDLNSANIAYKLLMKVGGAEAIGPLLMGMSKPVYVLQRGAEVEDIVHIAAIAVVDAQDTESPKPRKERAAAVVAAD
jgi:malate dehydrogenase (oxaloacetate-decarboxylating)(NADP+)